MRLAYTKKFNKQYDEAIGQIKDAFKKQASLLLQNSQHPSLDFKLYNKSEGVWQARVNSKWRFYVTIDGDIYTLLAITKHPK